MFSIRPITGTPALLNRSIARVASISARSCGVETITAPAGLCFWIMVSCTSPVPGGRSSTSSSASPQSASTSWPSAPPAIGPRQARRWFATGEHFDADTALRIGLVHQLVEPERLDEALERQLALLDKAGPIASSTAKQLVRQVRDSHDRDTLDRDNAALIARLRVSAEGQEGLGAFLDKRAPHWVTEA